MTAFDHRHAVVHLLYAASDEPDALRRISDLLDVDEPTVSRILDQPLRSLLPARRDDLGAIAGRPRASVS